MAGWADIFSLLMTIGVFGGTIWGVVYVVKQVTESLQKTKQKMKDKGYEISGKGVSIKTSKRFDRQDYIDATQRSMMKTMTATSFNRRPDSYDDSPNSSTHSSPANSPASASFVARPATVRRTSSNASGKTGGSGEKRNVFSGLRKNST